LIFDRIFLLLGVICFSLSLMEHLYADGVKDTVTLKNNPGKLSRNELERKRISLNFQDVEVKSVLQVLAEFTGINMVVSDTVRGNITLSLNNIPWEQALNSILITRCLKKRRLGNILFIAPAADIIKQEQKTEEGKLKLSNLVPLKHYFFQINYAKALDIANVLQDKNNTFLSARGKIAVDLRTNQLWIQENPARLAVIKKIIKQFDVPVKQVLIEARIVNVTKDVAEDLGLHFGISQPGTLRSQNSSHTEQNPSTALGERLTFDMSGLPLPASPVSMGVALAKLSDGILLDLELSALESEGRGEVVSSPRLITINQQPALIESGEEIPYQEATASGATAVSFKKAVLSLKVVPQITPDGKVFMDLKINQDIPTPKVFNGVPTILTKELQTNVLVNTGQTIVLGGIYKQDKNKEINRIPFFGDLPVVGRLFQNQSVSIRNEELLIFITPTIISTNSLPKYVGTRRKKMVRGVELNEFGIQKEKTG
jgi:type IV pilus assembly protein PilQ